MKPLEILYSQHFRIGRFDMFKDLFNFSKARTLTESIGFYIFYTAIALAFSGLAGLFG